MAPKKLTEREVLYRDVEFERLSPADADAQLIELGQKPFQSRRPDLSGLDPMLENEWTLPMAAGWFIWRSAVAVRDQWNPSREGWWKWIRLQRRTGVGPPGSRWKLTDFRRATVADVFSQVGLPADSHAGKATARKSVASDHVHTPYSRLEDALRSGRLRAAWGKRGDADFEEIAPEYWRLKFDAIANPKRQSSPEKPKAAPLRSTARPLISSKSTTKPRQATELPPSKMPTISPDEVEDFPDLSLVEAMESKNQYNIHEYSEPYDENKDIFVRREDVLKAEKEISQIEWEQPDWSLGQALGWIAYRRRETFRSLWETDLNPRPDYYGETYSTDFVTDDPARVLREALLSGKPIGRIGGRTVSTDEWFDLDVWTMRHTKFLRTEVIEAWAEQPAPPPPKKPLPSAEELANIHEELDRALGKVSTNLDFYAKLKELGIAPAAEYVKSFQREYLEKKGINPQRGRRTYKEPRPKPEGGSQNL